MIYGNVSLCKIGYCWESKLTIILDFTLKPLWSDAFFFSESSYFEFAMLSLLFNIKKLKLVNRDLT